LRVVATTDRLSDMGHVSPSETHGIEDVRIPGNAVLFSGRARALVFFVLRPTLAVAENSKGIG
jgi:hypothetical protein